MARPRTFDHKKVCLWCGFTTTLELILAKIAKICQQPPPAPLGQNKRKNFHRYLFQRENFSVCFPFLMNGAAAPMIPMMAAALFSSAAAMGPKRLRRFDFADVFLAAASGRREQMAAGGGVLKQGY